MSGAVNKPQQGSPGFTSLTARVDRAGDGLPGRQEMPPVASNRVCALPVLWMGHAPLC